MTDLIRKAVELADGWGSAHIYDGEDYAQFFDPDNKLDIPDIEFHFDKPTQCGLDALAAQLVRQVDALEDAAITLRCYVTVHPGQTRINRVHNGYQIAQAEGPDRTLNTIKAIVESGVLDEQ